MPRIKNNESAGPSMGRIIAPAAKMLSFALMGLLPKAD